MLAFAVIFCSTLFGLASAPAWTASCCGIVLACLSAYERRAVYAGPALFKTTAIPVTLIASMLVAQAASVGSYGAGYILASLILR